MVGAAGSVPREAGARIVLRPDGGFYGSIGGGRLEYKAIAAARAALQDGRSKAQFRDDTGRSMSTQIAGVPDLTEEYAEVNGIRLHYVEAGEGTAGRPAPRLSRVLVSLAPPDPGARAGRLSCRRARHARLQPL